MLAYCPTCSNMLLVELTDFTKELRYCCQTCPYVYKITKKITKHAKLENKAVDDVLGGAEAWKNVQKTDVTCQACSAGQAYFMEVQTRSADEPATIFYRCVECEYIWKEG